MHHCCLLPGRFSTQQTDEGEKENHRTKMSGSTQHPAQLPNVFGDLVFSNPAAQNAIKRSPPPTWEAEMQYLDIVFLNTFQLCETNQHFFPPQKAFMQRDLIRFKGLKFVPLSQQRGRCCSRPPRQLRTEEGSSQQHSPPPPSPPGRPSILFFKTNRQHWWETFPQLPGNIFSPPPSALNCQTPG